MESLPEPPAPPPSHLPPCFVLHSCSLSQFSRRNDDMPIDLHFHCSTGEAEVCFPVNFNF